jgi:hypothetical protein
MNKMSAEVLMGVDAKVCFRSVLNVMKFCDFEKIGFPLLSTAK